MFGAIGDATCDQVPLQIGQFESDNRMDEQLGNILIEGGGGGQKTESYEQAAYFMARHTALDSLEQRGKRGYLFIIGDETNYPYVYARGANTPATGWGTLRRRGVAEVIGDHLQEDIPTPAIYAELERKLDVYFILPAAASYGGDPEVLQQGATCSDRTSSNSTTSTPSAKPSPSSSASARTPSTSTRGSTTSTTSAPMPAPPSARPSPRSPRQAKSSPPPLDRPGCRTCSKATTP